VYVKRWQKTKHATLFRLSNKVVQVVFEDKSELVMSSMTKKVFYKNKKEERFCYPLATALDSGNQEMIKRLNYSRQVLEQSIQRQSMRPVGSALTQRMSSNEARGALNYQTSTNNLQNYQQQLNQAPQQ
jgi:polo-like kinase 1